MDTNIFDYQPDFFFAYPKEPTPCDSIRSGISAYGYFKTLNLHKDEFCDTFDQLNAQNDTPYTFKFSYEDENTGERIQDSRPVSHIGQKAGEFMCEMFTLDDSSSFPEIWKDIDTPYPAELIYFRNKKKEGTVARSIRYVFIYDLDSQKHGLFVYPYKENYFHGVGLVGTALIGSKRKELYIFSEFCFVKEDSSIIELGPENDIQVQLKLLSNEIDI